LRFGRLDELVSAAALPSRESHIGSRNKHIALSRSPAMQPLPTVRSRHGVATCASIGKDAWQVPAAVCCLGRLKAASCWIVDSLHVSYVVAPVVATYELAVLELPGPVDPAHPQPVQSDYSGAR
jgi:hypothetical protein